MVDGRNGGGRKPRPVREIPFYQIERAFVVSPLRLGLAVHPAVSRDERGYSIRVLVRRVTSGLKIKESFDYFRTDPTGLVTAAPRGYAKDYRPARITGMDAALAKYAVEGAS